MAGMKPTLVLSPLAVLTLTGLSLAQTQQPSRLVEMEIVDTPKQGAPHTTHFAVAVLEDHGWSSSKTSDTQTNVHASARIDHSILDVEVQRRGPGEFDIHGQKSISGAVPRTLLGRVERDGEVSEVYVTIR
jgi:hypothetical protein